MSDADTHRRFLGTKLFPSLDGLRGLSIIAVVWHHAGWHGEGILARGNRGVDLFFAISGFLITTLLLREQSNTGAISLRNFYIRRTLRIFPAYYAAVLLYTLVVTAVERHSPYAAAFYGNLPFFLTYTSNWFVSLNQGTRVIFYFAWSLATEEQFYLFWPSVVRFARRWYVPVIVMTGLLVASYLVNRWFEQSVPHSRPMLAIILGSVAMPICLGCLLAYATHRPAAFRVTYRLAGQPWSAPLAFALMLVCLSVEPLAGTALSVAMTYLVATCAVRTDHGMSALLDNRVLRYVGTVSYGTYLFHMLAINVVRKVLVRSGEPVLVFVFALPLAIGFATLSYRYFEQRFLALKGRYEVRTKPLAGAA